MFIFKRFFYKRNVWRWLCFTIVPSALPFFVSFVKALDTESANISAYVKINDLIFMGLSISISNVNAWRKKIQAATVDKAMSVAMLSFIVFSIALARTDSASGISTPLIVLVALFLLIGIKINMDIYTESNN